MAESANTASTYLRLKAATARKLGLRATGGVHYTILSDPERQHLFLTITGNEGGGYYSREIIRFDAIQACLPADPSGLIAAKALSKCCVTKTVNQPGFVMAVLHHEGLMKSAPDKAHQHIASGNWADWQARLLALDGEIYAPEQPAKSVSPASTQASPIEASVEPDTSQQDAPTGQKKPRRKAPGSEEAGNAQADAAG